MSEPGYIKKRSSSPGRLGGSKHHRMGGLNQSGGKNDGGSQKRVNTIGPHANPRTRLSYFEKSGRGGNRIRQHWGEKEKKTTMGLTNTRRSAGHGHRVFNIGEKPRQLPKKEAGRRRQEK